MSSFDRANEAVTFLTNSLPEGLRKPQVAIVCGSGLGGLAETVQSEPRAEFDYTSIPHFPRPTGILNLS
jgi:purine-nucleoside phosphorylase